VILSLKKEHYIELVPDKDDKRVKKIELTVTGKTYTNQQLQPFLQLDENIYQTMGESDYRLLISLLVKYGNALEHEF
jgi:DNA-binding MarR family transcriptional regulator